MSVKKADLSYINNETELFLGKKFKLKKKPLGHLSDKENMMVELIYKPDWHVWMQAQFFAAFTTWDNDHEISLDDIKEELSEAELRSLILDYERLSFISAVTESAVFQFRLTNIPRSMTAQINRHRGMSFNEMSMRVSPCHHNDIRIPEGISNKDKKDLDKIFDKLRKKYLKFIKDGIPIEQARNIIPIGVETREVMTCSLKALMPYIKHRTSEIAQDEHTYLVLLICSELKDKAFSFYKNFIKTEKLEELMKKYGVD